MDGPQLKTASTYLNNLLLARGLLRNGKTIDFARLGSGTHKNHDDGQIETKSRSEVTVEVVNLVHDLILRRDSEQESQESQLSTISSLRVLNSQQTAQLSQLQSQNQQLHSQLQSNQSNQRSLQSSLTHAESLTRGLREEVAKTRNTLQQVRQQCTNDIRKRDIQIQKLKGFLSDGQRGNNSKFGHATISINPGNNGSLVTQSNGVYVNGAFVQSEKEKKKEHEEMPNLEDAAYSLNQETTGFLTHLSQSLSDENDSLISLIRSTLTTLQELQGLPPSSSSQTLPPSDMFSNTGLSQGDDLVQAAPNSPAILSQEVTNVLNHLSQILTDASYVSISEVYARDEEIERLREGWEKMEGRWKEALEMMRGWSERMRDGKGTVELEELRRGVGLGEGLSMLEDVESSVVSRRSNSEEEEEIDGESLNQGQKMDELAEAEEPIVKEEQEARATQSATRTTQVPLKDSNKNIANIQARRATPVHGPKVTFRSQQQQENCIPSVHSSPDPLAEDEGFRNKIEHLNLGDGLDGRTNESSPTETRRKAALKGGEQPEGGLPSNIQNTAQKQRRSISGNVTKGTISAAVKTTGKGGTFPRTGSRARHPPTTASYPTHTFLRKGGGIKSNSLLTNTSSSSSDNKQRQDYTLQQSPNEDHTPCEENTQPDPNTYPEPEAEAEAEADADQDTQFIQANQQEEQQYPESDSDPEQPPKFQIPIQEKLQIAEREAFEAVNSPPPKPSNPHTEGEIQERKEEKKSKIPTSRTVKRKARRGKRKSTLSPEELEELMGLVSPYKSERANVGVDIGIRNGVDLGVEG